MDHGKRQAPRGDASKGPLARQKIKERKQTMLNKDQQETPSHKCTLKAINQSMPYIFNDGGNRLDQYIRTNTTH